MKSSAKSGTVAAAFSRHAPNDDPPAARHRRVDQHEEQAPERDRQEVEEGDQPGRHQPPAARPAERQEQHAARDGQARAERGEPRPGVGRGDRSSPPPWAVSCVTGSSSRGQPLEPGGAGLAQQLRRRARVEARICDSIEMKKAVVARALEAARREDRVVVARQPVEREDPSTAPSAPPSTPSSKVTGM
jgi:hypothetical protein